MINLVRRKRLTQNAAALKDKLEGYRQQYDVYSDIAKTYTEMSQGDYIGKLVVEEKRRREKEGKKREKKL